MLWRKLIRNLCVISLALLVVLAGVQRVRRSRAVSAHARQCARPTPRTAAACREAEAAILRATVRLRFETWRVRPDESGYDIAFSLGHATVVGERYLVTHNHHSIPLAFGPAATDSSSYQLLIVQSSAGDELLRVPLAALDVVRRDAGTLVLALSDGRQLAAAGVSSAPLSDLSAADLHPGMEVAQVDWDGAVTRVDWVQVAQVDLQRDVPRLVLDDHITPGASGGGVFHQGALVAVNWLLVHQLTRSGDLLGQVSVAALDAEAAGPGVAQ